MSLSKKMVLVGNILQLVWGVIAVIIGFVLSYAAVAANQSANLTAGATTTAGAWNLGLVGGLFFIVAILVVPLIVVNWIGFAKIDGPTGHGWKIYFLVIGIVSILSSFVLTGIFYILAYVFGRKSR